MTTLYVCEGSNFRAAHAETILTQAQAIISRKFRAGAKPLKDPRRTAEFLRILLGARDYEVFGLLHLDVHHRLIAVEELFRGTIDGASVYPREVARSVLTHGSAAVVLFHNHPSGISDPSQADEMLTRRLKETLSLIDVRILDHCVVGDRIFSFSEHGLI